MSKERDGALGFGMTNFKEVLEEIDKVIAERYVFSSEELPWKAKYWTASGEAIHNYGPMCIYEDGIVPHRVRVYRTEWLLNEAHSMLVERRYMLGAPTTTVAPVTPWAVMASAILAGTHDAMLNNDRMLLWTQRGLLGQNLGVVGNFPGASERTMRQELLDYTDESFADNVWRKVRMIDGDDRSPWQFYTNMKGRKSFIRYAMLKRGIWVARTWKNRTSIAAALREQWETKFDHPWSICEAMIDHHKWPDTSYKTATALRSQMEGSEELDLV